jgi:predicted phage terminase large subunit-like protein
MDDIDETKPKRGRPRKYNEVLNITRPKGRPKGSKNKPKLDSNTRAVIQDNTLHILTALGADQTNTIDIDGGDGTIGRDCLEIDHRAPTINKNISNNDNINDDNVSNVYISSNINISNENLSTSSDISIDISNNSNSNNILKNNSEILGANNVNEISNSSNKVLQNNKTKQTNTVKQIEITPELVIAARRHLALSSSAEYACLIDIPSAPAPEEGDYDAFSTIRLDKLAAHHRLICNEVDHVLETREHNLMIFAPPGSAKSTYVDIVCPTRAMVKYPRLQIILASYSDLPAFNQSKKAKQLCSNASFKALFPEIYVPKDSTAQDNWAISNGSSYRATGLMGDVTSYRCDVLIIDDPLKGRAEAESDTIRQKSWDSYIDNCVSRLKPKGIQIMMLTRWHEDDIPGRILPADWNGESGDFIGRDGRKWRVICLPAIADRDDDPLGRKIGERIWPEWFGEDHFTPFRMHARTWNSLYQQKPAPDDGDYFIRDNFKRYNKSILKTKELRYYMTTDYAVTENTSDKKKDPDNTVMYIWGIEETDDHEHNVHLIDGWSGKTKTDKWIKEQVRLIKQYKPIKCFGEAGVIQAAIEPALITALRKERLVTNLVWMPSNKSTGGKEVRARSAQFLAQEGRIFVPELWIEGDNFINECIKFPAGKHDDRVDNLSLIGRALDQITILRPKYKHVKPPTVVTPFNRNRL